MGWAGSLGGGSLGRTAYGRARTSSQTSRWSELGNGNVPVSRDKGSLDTGQNTAPPCTRSLREGST